MQIQQPDITVIIPVYNREKYIKRCAYSVLTQPCAEYAEIIIVDDGSTDKTSKICDEIASEHKNVKVIHKSNGGVAAARNTGIERAAGRHIAFLDSDDWWEKNFLDYNMLCEIREGHDIYEFSYNHINGNYKYQKTFLTKNEVLTYKENGTGKCTWHFHWSYIYKLDILKEYQLTYPDSSFSEDEVFLEKYFYFVKSHKKIDKVMYNYLSNDFSISHTADWNFTITEKYKAYLELDKWYLKHGEKYNFDATIGMIFSEMIGDMCGRESYDFCKNYIKRDVRFKCIENYNNIEIPPYYVHNVKSFMESTFVFWSKQKIRYITKVCIDILMSKSGLIYKFYNYILYKIVRKYDIISDSNKKFLEMWKESI